MPFDPFSNHFIQKFTDRHLPRQRGQPKSAPQRRVYATNRESHVLPAVSDMSDVPISTLDEESRAVLRALVREDSLDIRMGLQWIELVKRHARFDTSERELAYLREGALELFQERERLRRLQIGNE